MCHFSDEMQERQASEQQGCRFLVEPDFSQCPGSRFPFESFLFIQRLIVALWGGISPSHPGIGIFSNDPKCWRYTLHVNWSPSASGCSGGFGCPTSWLLSPSVYSGCFGCSSCRSRGARSGTRSAGSGIIIQGGESGSRHPMLSGHPFWCLLGPCHLQHRLLFTN